MTGSRETSEKLNSTLLFIISILNKNNVKKWFVSYGTLLGLVRENSCIDGDDDIDIIIDKNYYDDVKKLLVKNGFKIEHGHGIGKDTRKILKTKNTSTYASIDIYMGEFSDKDVFDQWNRLNIRNCFLDNKNKTFVEREWEGQIVYIPNNYKRILINRYGEDWHIKKDKKIPQSMREL